MNIERTKRIHAVLDAAIEHHDKPGVVIESRDRFKGDGWFPSGDPIWDFFEHDYSVRIPQITRVPLTREDWEGKEWVVGFANGDNTEVGDIEEDGICVDRMETDFVKFSILPTLGWLRSSDNGATWEPCWREVPGPELVVSSEERS